MRQDVRQKRHANSTSGGNEEAFWKSFPGWLMKDARV